jgi:hypothetical protein
LSKLRASLAAAVVVAAVVSGISVVHAASMGVTGGAISTSAVGHPCPGTAATTPAMGSVGATTFTGLSVTVPAGCEGRQLTVTVLSGTTVLRSGAAAVAASGETVVGFGTPAYTPTTTLTVQAVVDGWALPTTYTFVPHIWCTVLAGGGTCTATVALRTTWAGIQYWDIDVTATGNWWREWEVGFNLDHPFYGGRPVRMDNSDLDAEDVERASLCAEVPTFRVNGPGSGVNTGFRSIRSNRLREFTLVVDPPPEYWADYDDLLSPGCT